MEECNVRKSSTHDARDSFCGAQDTVAAVRFYLIANFNVPQFAKLITPRTSSDAGRV